MKITSFKGLKEAAKAFNKFQVLSYITDPGYGYGSVKLLLLWFMESKSYGLCIYDVELEVFIEEPADLEDYGFDSLTALRAKYPGL